MERLYRSLLAVLGILLLAGLGAPARAITPVPVEEAVAAELQKLAAAAPAVATLDARYRLTSTSTVDGVDSAFERLGRIYLDHGSVSLFRYLHAEVPEMHLVYRDGALLRWYPFAPYAHRIVPESWDKDDSDFGMVWRPFLAHLDPAREIATAPALKLAGNAGPKPVKDLASDPDQAAEVAARPAGARLEWWGPRPDITYVSSNGAKIERVDAVHYRASGGAAVESKRHTVLLSLLQVVNGVVVPTRIDLEAFLPGQSAPYRRITVELTDLRVNEPLPADAFQPTWPADVLFLDVETQGDTVYLPTADRPESMMQLADYYLGTDRREEGLKWIEKLRESFGGRRLTPSEVSGLARLYVRADLKEEGLKLHLQAMRQAQDEVAEKPEDPAPELELVRYYTEYAYFLARGAGPRLDEEAARLLQEKAGSLRSPLAAARLSGRAADHWTAADQYDKAREVLAAAQKTVAADPAAAAWVESCWLRVAEAQQRDEHMGRVRAKQARIKELKKEVAALAGKDDRDTRKLDALRAELARLEARP